VGSGALNFNGQSTYVETSDKGTLSGLSQLTASCWFKAKAFNTNETGYLISKDEQGDGDNATDSYSLCVSGGTGGNVQISGQIYSGSGTGPDGKAIWKTNTLKINQWYHVALSFNGNTIRLYLDGKQVSTGSWSKKPNSNKSTPLRIGQCSGSVTRYFDGAIDDVRLYNRSLTVSEVVSLYKLGKP